MKEVIKETANYVLTVGRSATQRDQSTTEYAYLVTNKKYGIVEIETFLLPQALKYIDDLQAGLDALLSMGDYELEAAIFKA